MKIEHEKAGVVVTRYGTLAAALAVASGKHHLHDLSSLVMRKLNLGKARGGVNAALPSVLHEPLWREYEGDARYVRTLAIAVPERETTIRDFSEFLYEKGYCPASVSEGASYLPVLAARGVKATPVFHLGTLILDENFREYRLLVRDGGEIDLIPFYPATTKLKPYYVIVVARKKGRS